MIYKNVQEVFVDEDLGIIAIKTDTEIIELDIQVRAGLSIITNRKELATK
jgi:hypothetical protein